MRVKPERSGEIPRGSLPLTILLYSFRPYLSAQPTVGRFVLGPPTGNPCGQVYKAYLSAKIVFAPARRGARAGEFWGYTAPIRSYSLPGDCHVASLLAMTVAKYRSARLAGGRGTPLLFKAFPQGEALSCLRLLSVYECVRF